MARHQHSLPQDVDCNRYEKIFFNRHVKWNIWPRLNLRVDCKRKQIRFRNVFDLMKAGQNLQSTVAWLAKDVFDDVINVRKASDREPSFVYLIHNFITEVTSQGLSIRDKLVHTLL
jgi:hypothetical protein